jgi:hypothetical protein
LVYDSTTKRWEVVRMARSNLLGLFALLAVFTVACGGDDDKDKTPDAAPCVPDTCQAQQKNCGSMPDGCGGVIQCGSCTAPELCGGGGTPNVCGEGSCSPTTCAAEGKDCDRISDGCSDVISCGTCTPPETCGGGGVGNVCGARPDAGTTKNDAATSPCDPSCMAQAGAVCCTECGCSGTVQCPPVCDDPFQWDCEMRCCFSYTTYKCQ